jgi:aerotaxis receptor
MRNNQPVTSNERLLERGKPIVTKTDLDGKITYVNQSFIDMSGYSRDELLGADHNIVRHPDMPGAAFGDLWATIRAGQPWRGLVKNRCKNGDFYWVEAYVTPITESGRPVGYMSVRNAPDRREVEAAAALYARLRSGAATMPPTLVKAGPGLAAGAALWCAAIATPALLTALVPAVPRIAGLGALLPLAGFAWWLSARVFGPVAAANRALGRLAEGQLQGRIDGRRRALDGLLVGLESLRIHLRAIFSDVLLGSRVVEDSAAALDDQIRRITVEAEQQAARVMQVAAAMEQMSVSISEISEHTRDSLTTSESSRDIVDTSGERMRDSLERTERIVGAVGESGRELVKLAEAIDRIAQVSASIREVADRTNLLALNAAIEAARAGEEGRGFAVVADEVRKLAEQTAGSTRDIHKTVEDVRVVAASTDHSIKAAIAEVGQSGAAIGGARDALMQIRDASNRVVSASREVAEMLKQQSSASHEVAANMEGISAAIDRTHGGLSAVESASGQLRGTAAELRELVRHLEGSLR